MIRIEKMLNKAPPSGAETRVHLEKIFMYLDLEEVSTIFLVCIFWSQIARKMNIWGLQARQYLTGLNIEIEEKQLLPIIQDSQIKFWLKNSYTMRGIIHHPKQKLKDELAQAMQNERHSREFIDHVKRQHNGNPVFPRSLPNKAIEYTLASCWEQLWVRPRRQTRIKELRDEINEVEKDLSKTLEKEIQKIK